MRGLNCRLLAYVIAVASACGSKSNGSLPAKPTDDAAGTAGAQGGTSSGGTGATATGGIGMSGAAGTTGRAGTSGTVSQGTGGNSGPAGAGGGSGPTATGGSGVIATGGSGVIATGGSGVTDGGSGGRPSDAAADAGDEPPVRPLAVDKTNPQLYTIEFKPSAADPTVSTNDVQQTAYLDTRVSQIRGKLVVTLSGTGNPPGPLGLTSYAASLGFHAFAVAYHNGWDPSTQSNPNFFGEGRFDEFDGMGRQKSFIVLPSESVQTRVTKALAYLQSKNPQGDWTYYLGSDGQVRWSDVIFFGQSHGATSAAAYAKLRRLSRAVSMSGPRDTNPVVATWLSLPSQTPIDRCYGFTGTQDPQHPDHLKAMEVLGYLGQVVDITQEQPPYSQSHRLQYDGAHTDDLTCSPFPEACQYLLGTLDP
jgi:hypothetical protein